MRLCEFEACLIPGLLQTEEYARAVISAGGLHPTTMVDELVTVRLERQHLWQRAESPQCVFVLDETALRRPIGGPAVLDAQLGRLMELADLPSVRLHVVPLDAGAHVGFTGGFCSPICPTANGSSTSRTRLVDTSSTTRTSCV